MSELKPSEKLSKELSEAVERILTELKSSKTTLTPEHQATQGHKTIDEVADCPTCRAKLIEKFKPDIEKDLRPAILKEIREKQKSMKHPKLCEDCGEILDGEKETDCPNCHSTHY